MGAYAPNSLVRYRGMVQETFDPAFYMAVVEEVDEATGATRLVPAKYMDAYTPPVGKRMKEAMPTPQRMAERLPLYCVPVPGESSWARAAAEGDADASADALLDASASEIGTSLGPKRGRDSDDEDDGAEGTGGGLSRGPRAPRVRAAEAPEGSGTGAVATATTGESGSAATKTGTEEEDAFAGAAAQRIGRGTNPSTGAVDLNFPLGREEEGLPCMVSVYDIDNNAVAKAGASMVERAAAAARPKINEVFEFIGILSVDPDLTVHHTETRKESGSPEDDLAAVVGGIHLGDSAEVLAHNPPASLVPRLHAVLYRRLASCEPVITVPPALLPATGASDEQLRYALMPPRAVPRAPAFSVAEVVSAAVASAIGDHDAVTNLRKQLMAVLTGRLQGDAVAAEFLLIHMLSRILSRPNGGMGEPLGKFSLNLCSLPSAGDADSAVDGDGAGAGAGAAAATATPAAALPPPPPAFPIRSVASEPATVIAETYAALMPRAVLLPLTRGNLCGLRFRPHKHMHKNILESGVLQLAAGTPVIVDETVLTTGNVDGRGVMNLKALEEVSSAQTLDYDFEFQQVHFNVDMPMLLLSTGKSLVRTDCIVPLEPNEEVASSCAAALAAVGDEFFAACRVYLAAARELQYSIPDAVATVVERTYVDARKADAKVNGDDMIRWLTMARLLAGSFGETELTEERWEYTMRLEAARKARNPPAARSLATRSGADAAPRVPASPSTVVGEMS